MKQHFELTLPEGYTQAMVVDCKDRAFLIKLNLLVLAVTASLIALCWVLIRPRFSFTGFADLLPLYLFAVLMFVYIVLHELVHGAAYKLLTGHKLTFGMTLSVAYCGVPDIFVYRTAALIALLSPFAVFTVAFLLPTLLLEDGVYRFVFGVLLSFHIGGCMGDLYDTWLYLTRFRDSTTLMQDTGPKQTFYTKA